MTRVKVCGITNLEDALVAIEHGADALGFIFVPGTPRYVGDWQGAIDVPLRILPFVTRVAVCRTAEDLPVELAARFDAIQYYGGDPRERFSDGMRLIKTYRVRDRASLDEIAADGAPSDALLLDAYREGVLGGSGHTFNWELACEAKSRFTKPIVLAGGLHPDNVAEAAQAVRPYAVDVSSGVEASPGKKDHGKVQRFIEAVRRADGGG